MYIQVQEKEWKEVANPIAICSIEIPTDLFIEKYGLEGFTYLEDGLGQLTAVVVKIDDTLYWIRGSSGREAGNFTVFEVRSYEQNTLKAFKSLCESFNLDHSDFHWVSDSLGEAQWVLSRIDDNGNEVIMYKFHDERTVNFVKNLFERRGHKQAYFIAKNGLDKT